VTGTGRLVYCTLINNPVPRAMTRTRFQVILSPQPQI